MAGVALVEVAGWGVDLSGCRGVALVAAVGVFDLGGGDSVTTVAVGHSVGSGGGSVDSGGLRWCWGRSSG